MQTDSRDVIPDRVSIEKIRSISEFLHREVMWPRMMAVEIENRGRNFVQGGD